MAAKSAERAHRDVTVDERVLLTPPTTAHGAAMWRIARDSGKLDLNSSYAYLLWCRDFADTSVVAIVDGAVAGYVTGYRRPDRQDTVVVWQIAVDAARRGRGLAGRLLDDLLGRLTAQGVTRLETTITPDNTASAALFTALARRWRSELASEELFPADRFPDDHDSEHLYRIGPLDPTAR